jgi:hypothetical protein
MPPFSIDRDASAHHDKPNQKHEMVFRRRFAT